MQEVKRAAVAEVQRAVAVAVAESRASERLRSQRYLDSLPMSQQQHQQRVSAHPATAAAQQQQHARPSPFLRLAVEARTASGTPSTATSSTGAPEDEKDAHLVSGTSAVSFWGFGMGFGTVIAWDSVGNSSSLELTRLLFKFFDFMKCTFF